MESGELLVLNVSFAKSQIGQRSYSSWHRHSNHLIPTDPKFMWAPVLDVSFTEKIPSSLTQKELRLVCVKINQEGVNENTSLVLVQWAPFHWRFIFPSFLIRKSEILIVRFGHLMRFLNLFHSLMEKMFTVHWQGLSFCGLTHVETSCTSQFYFTIPHSKIENSWYLVSF